jgi:transaldolase
MYKDMGVPKERVLVKLAATWEGITAAEILEREGIQCNLTLIFSVVQAIACAQRSIHLISPFPGRILDWYRVNQGRTDGVEPEKDEGVIAVKEMYNYFKTHSHDTICMPASWRPSRGPGYELDEILALAGADRMTIPAPLLEKLAASTDPVPRKLSVETAKASNLPEVGGGMMDEKEFRYRLNMDSAGTEKLAEGIRAFIGETEKLEKVITDKVHSMSSP